MNNNNNTPLHTAAWRGNFPEVRRLINAGVNVNARNNENQTPLMVAAHRGHANIVRYLLRKGANARARQARQEGYGTALIYAAMGGNVNTIRPLIILSNLNAQDKHGQSALHHAVNRRYSDIVRMLVRAGARTNNVTLENKLYNRPEMRNLIESLLVRRAGIAPRMRAAMTTRKNRNLAMRQELSRAIIQEGSKTTRGLPREVRNLIGMMVRGRRPQGGV